MWVIRDHKGKDFANIKGQDAEYYYALPEREQTFTEEWATTHAVPIADTLRGLW